MHQAQNAVAAALQRNMGVLGDARRIGVSPLVLFAGHLDFTCFCQDTSDFLAGRSLGAMPYVVSLARLRSGFVES